MASTRLRRTFNYPAGSEDDDAVEEGMDEKDQEHLLSTLSTKDNSSTRLYTQLLLIFPLAPILLYVPRLLNISTLLPSVLTIASLLTTAYILYFLPLPPVKIKVTTTGDAEEEERRARTKENETKRRRAMMKRTATGFSSRPAPAQETPPVPYISEEVAEGLKTYAVPVNGAVCVVFALGELIMRRSWDQGVMIGGGYLPGLVMAVCMWARKELRVVDLGELERLRYRGKGN